ncbi:MAG: hypothetical protein EBX49_09430 [Synechococcaceae bacterium WB8_1B_136]|nr:hypothetical protein [Synechococcaceae bacterium WB8_1B_136]
MADARSAPTSPGPADLLRARLTSGRGRLAVIAATTCVWVMDLLLVHHLENRRLIDPALDGLVHRIDLTGTLAFIVITLCLTVSLFRGRTRELFRWALVYLLFSVVQVITNVLSMVASAGSHQGGGLGGLWDVAAVYVETVLVFMFVYIFLDVSTPGGAFVWPSRDGEVPPEPHLIDYLFISMNVNSTYGPTSEAVMSRPAKLVMSLQVLLAIVMLTVLIARTVSSTS